MSCQLQESAQPGMVAVIAVAATVYGGARSHLQRNGH